MPVPCREHIIERLFYGTIGSNAANKVDRLLKSSFLEGSNHPSNAFAERIEHCFDRDALLLQMNKVSLGKDTASGGYPGRTIVAFQCQASKVIHANAKPVRLLLKEPSSACSTKGIRYYLPRLSQPVLQPYDKGALAANLYDSFSARITMEQP